MKEPGEAKRPVDPKRDAPPVPFVGAVAPLWELRIAAVQAFTSCENVRPETVPVVGMTQSPCDAIAGIVARNNPAAAMMDRRNRFMGPVPMAAA